MITLFAGAVHSAVCLWRGLTFLRLRTLLTKICTYYIQCKKKVLAIYVFLIQKLMLMNYTLKIYLLFPHCTASMYFYRDYQSLSAISMVSKLGLYTKYTSLVQKTFKGSYSSQPSFGLGLHNMCGILDFNPESSIKFRTCIFQPKTWKSKKKTPWFQPWFNILVQSQGQHCKPKSCIAHRELPLSQFPQGKTCFHYREPLFSLQGPCFHYRDFPVNPLCAGLVILVWKLGFFSVDFWKKKIWSKYTLGIVVS